MGFIGNERWAAPEIALRRPQDGAQSGELISAVAPPGRVRRVAEQDSTRSRREGGREGFGIQGEVRWLELDERRSKPDVARIERIVEPAGDRNDDLVTGSGCSPQSDVQGCHCPRCEDDVPKRERKAVTFLQGVRDGAPD